MNNNSVQTMNNPALFKVLSDVLEFPVLPTDISKPDPNKISKIYFKLHEILITSKESFRNNLETKFNELSPYPIFSSEAITLLSTTHQFCSFVNTICKMKDFSHKDFTTPDAKRTKRVLSKIINYLYFREEILEKLNKKDEELDELKREYQTELDHLEKTKAKKMKKAKENEKHTQEVNSLKKERDSLAEQWRSMKTRLEQKKAQLQKLKEAEETAEQRKESTRAERNKLQNYLATLESQIRSDPPNLKKQVSVLEHRRRKLASEVEKTKTEVQTKDVVGAKLHGFNKLIGKRILQINEIANSVADYNLVTKATKKGSKRVEDLKAEMERLKRDIKEAKILFEKAKRKFEECEENEKEEKEKRSSRTEEHKRVLETKAKRNEGVKLEVELIEDELSKIGLALNAEMERNLAHKSVIDKSVKELLDAVDYYCKTMEENIK